MIASQAGLGSSLLIAEAVLAILDIDLAQDTLWYIKLMMRNAL
jgi:hypothetical protein